MNIESANILLLALDDDLDELEIFEDIFKQYEVDKYELCFSVDKFEENLNADINLCIIDHKLGVKTGIEVIKKIKDKNKENYVIVASGIEDFDVAVEYIRAGANWWAKKNAPDYKEQLVEGLRKGFAEAQERRRIAIELAEKKSVKDERITKVANRLIEIIEKGTSNE